jgi:8-oxo-dGTP pyrophosphatase MutT (NUDIX family)
MSALRSISEQLAGFEPSRSPDRRCRRRSAVALLVRDGGDDAQVLMIERSHRPGDPWSGHMAFPGGRLDAGDAHSFAAAKRETREEIGVDVDTHGQYLGRLSDISTHLRTGTSAMLVTPFVFALQGEPQLSLNHEVADTLWVPLSFLADAANRQRMHWQLDGLALELPCYFFEGRRIWGLSLGMLDEFLAVSGMAQFESRRRLQ